MATRRTVLSYGAVRIVLVAVVTLLACAVPASGGPPKIGSSQYVVQPDPRLCPSPRCGGYWVALANHPETRSHDGTLQPRCYVAVAVDEQRHGLEASLPPDALVRAALEARSFGGLGELGVLAVADIRAPTGQKRSGVVYRVRDLGVRCIRAPCFSLRVARVNGSFRTTLSDLDLRPALLTPEQRAQAGRTLAMPVGLFVAGRIVAAAGGGLVLRASRVYLRVAPPRG
jgi:hypothetical protein